jgi:hypothetical protein
MRSALISRGIALQAALATGAATGVLRSMAIRCGFR